jgi:nitroimidazol reductase NimA-like FMN-containing flavoprotein (pyridoxamine 5'-phosphate oxidase superfamily)
MTDAPASSRVEVRRAPERGVYGRSEIASILDEGFVCHLGFVPPPAHPSRSRSNGAPVVLPTMYARSGDRLYIHGAPAGRMLKSLRAGIDVCLTVTHLDGLVYARSAFHHSMNYRSVVVMGRALEVTDTEEKLLALRALVERFGSGRWEDARKPSLKEFNKTLVLAVSLDEASAKVRTGPPADDVTDHQLEVWAGVVPLTLSAGEAEPDPLLPRGIGTPAYVTGKGI